MIAFVKRKRLQMIFKLMIVVFTLFVVNIFVMRSHRILFFETWTPIESTAIIGVILFGVMCTYALSSGNISPLGFPLYLALFLLQVMYRCWL
ncbi:MAG: hypothetical protein A2Y45_04235 [Tenericutes bacterium GWC2_34_14]|nr:MAG: hypothetical protein A2Z84_08130 [Tenericutes bacterium GWA2_35_7]OHE28810.1 MAG: hypothetical protein A2Y45_04235 [Tenericutes bacterium GWC2_34_14]OHE33278.1 MAG: hypothetical protein A2012_06015 [Tenericutes bacterium GWE2_34_108]OHE36428.1 MAG: hypothetical protein A2Y46_08120 [Tenericutes bacterium GWF1_35_14]OHE37632.1 MAG: hypothetical protein A2Y44_03045 [Tenericutes bacterium GWF2_35_184]OHE45091.1 MAG: hypothetical protein A2221_02465 [Tenericutes bacterium RIFOXYA2_FULL_36_3